MAAKTKQKKKQHIQAIIIVHLEAHITITLQKYTGFKATMKNPTPINK